MAILKLYQRQKKVHLKLYKVHKKDQSRILANQNGLAVLEGVVSSIFLTALMLIFFKTNAHFDHFEEKSIRQFQKKWNHLEGKYGKAK